MIEQKHLDLLLELNADENPHSGGELLDHLRGTNDFLAAWGNDQPVCLGGLFHSIYGTQSYKTESASLEDREHIRAVIGERGERLAFLFCVSHRWHFFERLGQEEPVLWDRIKEEEMPVTQDELRDLVEMEVANYIEFMPRLDFTGEELDQFQDRVESAKEQITAKAYRAINEVIAAKRASIGQ